MTHVRTFAIVFAACAALTVARASAQTASTPPAALRVPPEAKGQPSPQGFSVVLVLGDNQMATTAENVPAAARKALVDIKDFLPYKGYRLLDAQWILGSQRSTSRLRGPEDQEYQLTLRSTQIAGGRIQVTFQLQEPGTTVVAVRDNDEAAIRQAEAEMRARLEQKEREAAALKERLGEKHLAAQNAAADVAAIKMRLSGFENASTLRGRAVIETSFAMDIGETVVVGTSRMRGGDKALIALLTAVPKGR
jgi:hypothetical protein